MRQLVKAIAGIVDSELRTNLIGQIQQNALIGSEGPDLNSSSTFYRKLPRYMTSKLLLNLALLNQKMSSTSETNLK
jgi:hypothetical protein